MRVTTKTPATGKAICSDCGGTLELKEDTQHYTPRDGVPYTYIMEFSQCSECKNEIVECASILKNGARAKQARLESTVAYKMKKWVQQNQDLQ